MKAQNIIYLSCDDPELRLLTSPSSDSRINLPDILDVYEQLREKTIKELKANEKIYLFLDEVHFWQGWQFEIKKYFDKKYPLKFILSGSASLIKRGSESLMGRTIEELILPFSFYEFLSCQLKDKRLDKIIFNLQKDFAPSDNLLKGVTSLFLDTDNPKTLFRRYIANRPADSLSK